MNYRTPCLCMLVATALASASAQTRTSMWGKCDPPKVDQSISIPDQPGHLFTLLQATCTVTGQKGGLAVKTFVVSEQGVVIGNHVKDRAITVDTLANGDKVFAKSQTTATLTNAGPQSATATYQITGGTGEVKGIQGSGTCRMTDSDFSCSGVYTIPGGKATTEPTVK